MNNHPEQIVVTEAELAATDHLRLDRETRRQILTHWKAGRSVAQIVELLELKRHQVRSTVNPDYTSHGRGEQSETVLTAAVPQEITKVIPQAKTAKTVKLTSGELAIRSEQEKKYDEFASKQDCIDDLNAVQSRFPLSVITRNKYRNEGQYSDATWNQYFGTFHEFRRAARLELSRYQHQLEKQIAKHSSLDHYRDIYADEFEPYLRQDFNKPGDVTRDVKIILSGSDFHDEDCDRFMLRVFLDTAERVQPDVIVLNGDVFDLYEFSRYDIDPRQMKLKDRFDFVKEEIFGPLRTLCPDARIVFLLGNHEWRLLKHLADRTPHMKVLLSDVMGLTLEDVFGVREYEIELHCRWDLAAFMKGDVKSQVKENYVVFYDCFVAAHIANFGFGLSGTSGHTHRPDLEVGRNLAAGRISWTVTGSMCRTGAEYVSGFDKAMKGFALFHVDTRTNSVIPENILVPGDLAVVAGKYYERQPGEY